MMENLAVRLRDPLLKVCTAAPIGLLNEAADEVERAVALIRVLVAYSHEPLPDALVRSAAIFLERYPYEQRT